MAQVEGKPLALYMALERLGTMQVVGSYDAKTWAVPGTREVSAPCPSPPLPLLWSQVSQGLCLGGREGMPRGVGMRVEKSNSSVREFWYCLKGISWCQAVEWVQPCLSAGQQGSYRAFWQCAAWQAIRVPVFLLPSPWSRGL